MFKRVSLAQQLAQLEKPAPGDFDPEDAFNLNNEADKVGEDANSEAREHYLDVGPSALRNKLRELSDPKYEGVLVSRKQLEDDDNEELDDTFDDADSRPVTPEGEDVDSEEVVDGDSRTEHTENGVRRDHAPDSIDNASFASRKSEENDLSSTLKRAREEERKKGKAVARQLALFDSLLDARIRLQKCVASMNKLPNSANLPTYLEDSESRESVNKLLSGSLGLANDISEVQEKFATADEGINPPARKRRRPDYDLQTDPDWDEELQESSRYFMELEANYHQHLVTTLQKWSNKVLAIAPSALLPSNRTKFSSKNASQVKSAVQLVDEALLERERLTARTRTWRGTGIRLNSISDPPPSNAMEAVDSIATDIFDDTDFYQTLLRDVIDTRAGSGRAGSGLVGVTADWRAAQQQRKKARQKTIDTRASKGRKLRFEVHEKLQNFMAPGPPPGSVVWHEEQIDELFASLLGKGFPDTDIPPEESRSGMDIDVESSLKGGFRVFG